jgi:toxin ParE1/3/4
LRKFSVSKRAQSDLRAIAIYTVRKWGTGQAVVYAKNLEACFQTLAEMPGMGRCDAISPGLHRHEQGKHVVFYRLKPGGIRITRVLHQQMIPNKPQLEP